MRTFETNPARAFYATHRIYSRRTWLTWSDVEQLLVGARARARKPATYARLDAMVKVARLRGRGGSRVVNRRRSVATVPIPHRTLAEIAAELNQERTQSPLSSSQPEGSNATTTTHRDHQGAVMTAETQTEQPETGGADVDTVIRRIQKILNFTKAGATHSEAEADNAMKMAQKLAMAHNLDLAQIEAAQNKTANAPIIERVKDKVAGRAVYNWQRQLAKYVAEAWFCYYMVSERQEWRPAHVKHKGKTYTAEERSALTWEERRVIESEGEWKDGRYQNTKAHIFVGRLGNVMTAQLMFQYLTQVIEDSLPITDNSQRLSRSAVSWREGCADRLCERLAQRRADLIKEHDARIKEEMAAVRADFEAKRTANKVPMGLPANEKLETKAAFEDHGADAYDRSGPKPKGEEQDRPEPVAGDDWTPGDGIEPEPEESPGTAMVLASIFDQSERDANYEVAHNLEAGTLVRWRREYEESQAKAAEAAAKGEVESIEEPVKQETDRQRKARERREAEERAKSRRRWARESATEARREAARDAKRDHRAYYAGARKADDIGLDTQIAEEGKHAPKKLG